MYFRRKRGNRDSMRRNEAGERHAQLADIRVTSANMFGLQVLKLRINIKAIIRCGHDDIQSSGAARNASPTRVRTPYSNVCYV